MLKDNLMRLMQLGKYVGVFTWRADGIPKYREGVDICLTLSSR